MLEMITITAPAKAQRFCNCAASSVISFHGNSAPTLCAQSASPQRDSELKTFTTEMNYFALHNNTKSVR